MMMKIDHDIPFFDTSSLLLLTEEDINNLDKIYISSITLEELEQIKNLNKYNLDLQYSARLIIKLINQNLNKFNIIIHNSAYEIPIINKQFEINNDMKILSDAYYCNNYYEIDKIVFITNDLSLYNIANLFFGSDMIKMFESKQKEEYCGYREIYPTNEELELFYSDNTKNIFNLYTNEYLILKNQTQDIIDIKKWNGEKYIYLNYDSFNSEYFNNIKPYKHDIYQQMAFDSLINNKITMLRGKAGSGKTTLALSYLFDRLEHGKIDKIIIFCNTVATLHSAKLGYYPGDKNSKLLDSQIGNMLISKIGSRSEVERLIEEETLILLPFSDIRGYSTSGMRAGIYFSEAQNLDCNLIKLGLQRIGEDCICIIDGDNNTQLDDIAYTGRNNGMNKVSEVFRGEDIYGEIKLQNCYRSKIAKIAERI